jgi:hypothetical protein
MPCDWKKARKIPSRAWIGRFPAFRTASHAQRTFNKLRIQGVALQLHEPNGRLQRCAASRSTIDPAVPYPRWGNGHRAHLPSARTVGVSPPHRPDLLRVPGDERCVHVVPDVRHHPPVLTAPAACLRSPPRCLPEDCRCAQHAVDLVFEIARASTSARSARRGPLRGWARGQARRITTRPARTARGIGARPTARAYGGR